MPTEPRTSPEPTPSTLTPRSFRCKSVDLWDAARERAADNGETVTDVLNRALEEYVR